jgi:type I restriction enzyme R subunit
VELPGFASSGGFERFRAKARHFLKAHADHVAINKLRMNKPLTPTDLSELERMLVESGIGTADDVLKAKEESHGLGFFVRALVGLDRETAKRAFAGFLAGKTMTANQIEFVNLIIDHLTERGFMDPALLYASPYTDFSPKGVEGVFSSRQVDEMVSILDDIRKRAAAA